MTQPTQYTPTTDFSQDEANNVSGRSTVNTAALDAEFANIETTIDSVCDNLALLQRDDGRLADLTVEHRCLSQDVLTLMGGFNLRGLWVEATDYAVNDICSSGAYTYCCKETHTSGAEIDLTKWIQFGFTSGADAAQAAASAQTSATAAAGSASSAATSATNAANSAASISGSVSQAAGYAATATTKAGEASSSATSAANSAASAAASVASISFPLSVSNGGTGISSLSGVVYGNGSGAFSVATASQIVGAIGSQAVQKSTKISAGGESGQVYKSTGNSTDPEWGGSINSSAAVTASGTAVDFIGIPIWANRIAVDFSGVSTNGTSSVLIQLGTASGFISSGYDSTNSQVATSSVISADSAAGFVVFTSAAAATFRGIVNLSRMGTSNEWIENGVIGRSVIANISTGKVLSGDAVTQLRITTVNGTDAFDAGTISISWE